MCTHTRLATACLPVTLRDHKHHSTHSTCVLVHGPFIAAPYFAIAFYSLLLVYTAGAAAACLEA
jgi:hypothetical protein